MFFTIKKECPKVDSKRKELGKGKDIVPSLLVEKDSMFSSIYY